MEDGILSLKWNNHNSTFIQTLSTLHNAETYSDVTLACEGKYFPVHKLVLSICSEYFEEILSRTKCQHPVIVLKDIKHGDLEALLNYMYAGEANVAQNELASLIKSAECLRIKGLAVPDEAPPVRDKRRHNEVSESANLNKRRRNDELYLPNSNQSYDSSRIIDISKNKRRLEDVSDHISDIQSERNSTISLHEDETYKSIPEIVLEGQPVEVKQEITEPKIEEHVEEESHNQLESSNLGLGYDVGIVDESSEGDRQGQESHILQDLIGHSVPGPSGVQGHEVLSNWENNSNNLGYSVDSYSSDEGRNQQMGIGSLDHHSFRKETNDVRVSQHGAFVVGRAWQCPYQYCGYMADRESALTKHVRKHTGEKPFSCSLCSYSSAQNSNLTSHMKVKHPNVPKSFPRTSSDNLRQILPYRST